MKRKALLAAAVVLTFNIRAEKPIHKVLKSQPVITKGHAVSMTRNVDNSRFSVIDPSWETTVASQEKAKPVESKKASTANALHCYKFIDNKMFEVKNGELAAMTNHKTLKNGSVVLINGVVITKKGKTVHLNNGDIVDIKGHIALAVKAETKEQATL